MKHLYASLKLYNSAWSNSISFILQAKIEYFHRVPSIHSGIWLILISSIGTCGNKGPPWLDQMVLILKLQILVDQSSSNHIRPYYLLGTSIVRHWIIGFFQNKYRYRSASYTILYFSIWNDFWAGYNQVASKIYRGRSKIRYHKAFWDCFCETCLPVGARALNLPQVPKSA